eukprot:GHVR01008524.1.p1 GENE.GHVR01008524.1~~GHVR01008524.1.p1  ORF type:complete len:455 (-),score=102.96 GHVR01008524.1:94-1458(-)
MSLPQPILFELYEQVVLEMLELGECDFARQLLRETATFIQYQSVHPDKYKLFIQMTEHKTQDSRKLWENSTRETKRGELAQKLVKEVQEAPPSRLLGLIGHAIKWQTARGILPKGAKVDLFRGTTSATEVVRDELPTTISKSIKLESSHVECAVFSPDGEFLVTGSSDGFVEVWDVLLCQLREDLQYQADGEFMLHRSPVLALSFSRDGEFIASADQNGDIKVWKLSTGKCQRILEKAHEAAITSITFSRETTHILTSSFDATCRVHGLRSGNTLRQFVGHVGIVQTATYAVDGTRVVSGGDDGTVKVWDSRQASCLLTFTPPRPIHINTSSPPPPVLNIFHANGHTGLLYVLCKSNSILLMSVQGQVVRTISSGKRDGGDFVAATCSPGGEFVFCGGEDFTLYSFTEADGHLQHIIKLHEKDIIGLAHHPKLSILASWGADGHVHMLTPAPPK